MHQHTFIREKTCFWTIFGKYCHQWSILHNHIQQKRQWLWHQKNHVPVQQLRLYLENIMFCIWWDMKRVVYYAMLNSHEEINFKACCLSIECTLFKKRISAVLLFHDHTRRDIAKSRQENILGFEYGSLTLFTLLSSICFIRLSPFQILTTFCGW